MTVKTKSSAATARGTSSPPAVSFGPSIPTAEDGIQCNFCKNLGCSQYGFIPSGPRKRGVVGPCAFTSGGKGFPLLSCNACGETPPLKSHGIAEEVRRLSAYLKPAPERPAMRLGHARVPNTYGDIPYFLPPHV